MSTTENHLAQLRARKIAVDEEVGLLRGEARSRELNAGEAERLANLEAGADRLREQITEAQNEHDQRDRIRQAASNPRHIEAGADFGGGNGADTRPLNHRDAALRAIERIDDLSPAAGDNLTNLIERDSTGVDAAYLAAVSSPAYFRAFGQILRSPQTAHLSMEPAEVEAVREVARATEARDALAIGSGATGGFAVPIAIDPTVMLTSDGELNPLRQVARVRSITTSELRLVASAGVEADFVAEGTEATDDAPTLSQPTIRPQRAQCFVPFSIETGQDWAGLGAELARLIADAKDALEGDAFVNGAGETAEDEPEGLIAGLPAGSKVDTAGAGTLATADVYAIQEALPPRFQPRARFLSTNAIMNHVHRLEGGGASDERGLTDDGRTRILGRPWTEVSSMDAAITAGKIPLAYGDIAAGYTIVDRVGLSVELVPHLFGSARRYPTGERGLYAFWRTSAAVVVPNAVRALVVDAG